MPDFSSTALYIDFARLPPPKVIEEIDYEALLQIYRQQVVTKNPNLAKAVSLEQSATNIILETEAYAEMIVRARVNSAARAVMLPFATGTDLDNLAAFYGVDRAIIPGDPSIPTPDIPESDARFRRRVQLSIEAQATGGTAGGYIFHALTSDPTLHDATAIQTSPGHVQVAVMSTLADPVPTEAQIEKVKQRLFSASIKPLTDILSVVPATKLTTTVNAQLVLYPGPDSALVMASIQTAMTAVRNRINLLGRDLTRSALIAALYQEGVQSVILTTPATDVVAEADECVSITSATVTVLDNRVE